MGLNKQNNSREKQNCSLQVRGEFLMWRSTCLGWQTFRIGCSTWSTEWSRKQPMPGKCSCCCASMLLFFYIDPASITAPEITHWSLMTTFSIQQMNNGNPRARKLKNEVAPPRKVIPKLVTSLVDGFHQINRIHGLLFSEQNPIHIINNWFWTWVALMND